MAKIENIIGKKLQIKFSPPYLQQVYKTDIDKDVSVETETESLINCIRFLSAGINVDSSKLELYALMTALGKVEFGKKGLAYINELLPSNVPAITEPELVYHNLKKIFKQLELSIDTEAFQEFCEMYKPEQENDSLEIKMFKLALCIETITHGVKKIIANNSNIPAENMKGTELKINEIKKMKTKYKEGQGLKLTEKLTDLNQKIERLYSTNTLSETQKEEMKQMMYGMLETAKTRADLLESVYTFQSGMSKKKARG